MSITGFRPGSATTAAVLSAIESYADVVGLNSGMIADMQTKTTCSVKSGVAVALVQCASPEATNMWYELPEDEAAELPTRDVEHAGLNFRINYALDGGLVSVLAPFGSRLACVRL